MERKTHIYVHWLVHIWYMRFNKILMHTSYSWWLLCFYFTLVDHIVGLMEIVIQVRIYIPLDEFDRSLQISLQWWCWWWFICNRKRQTKTSRLDDERVREWSEERIRPREIDESSRTDFHSFLFFPCKLGGGGGGGGGSSGGGSYGFRRDRDNDRQTEIQRDTIFIQDLPKDVTKEQLQDAFSGVGRIKVMNIDRSSSKATCFLLLLRLDWWSKWRTEGLALQGSGDRWRQRSSNSYLWGWGNCYPCDQRIQW